MKRISIGTLAALAAFWLPAQEREDRTLLSWAQMRAIINEASGERALHHTLELAPYPRVRSRAEYEGRFRESEVMARFAREYGFSDVEIESYPSPAPIWHASQAELWMVRPEEQKLYDVHDVAVSVISGSESGEVTAELVDLGGGGRAEDYAGKDVAGKIVLGSASASTLQRLAVFDRGAAGVLSYSSLRADSFPDQILTQSLAAAAPQEKKVGFGWSIAPRAGRELAARLARGENVTLRSLVKADQFPGELEMVHATIPGDGSSGGQAVMISAHLYEGYQKQGANDDNSGCAVTLEMGRALLRLVAEGKLPRPRRTIHFLWVPEISGTTAWLRKHEDVRQKLIADLNFDMEGLNLRASASFWTLHRTPDTFPSFLNDLSASVMEFVADLNRERVRYRHHGYRFTLPVVAPNGSFDPFYIRIEKHYGASDHAVYLNQGIPAVIFVTWPDMWYHSSQDTPDKLDSTQFKRVAVVGTAAMSVLASADDQMGARVAAETLARGAERMGQAERKGLGYMADAGDGAALAAAYREARNAVRHQADVEKAALRSAAVLFAGRAEGEKKLAGLESLIAQRAIALENETRAYYQMQDEMRGAPTGQAAEPSLSDAEKLAMRTVAERVGPAGGGGGGLGAAQAALNRLPADQRQAAQSGLAKVPQHMAAELGILLGRKKTVLEIRDFLSGEFEPLPLDDLMAYLKASEKLGRVKLVEQPLPAAGSIPPPVPVKKGRGRSTRVQKQ